GRVGWAIVASEAQETLSQRQQGLEDLIRMLSADRVARFDFAVKASSDAASCRDLIELWAAWWRDLLLLSASGRSHLVNLDRTDELERLARKADLAQAWAVLSALESTAAQIDANVNARLALESLLLKLPRWEIPPSVGGGNGS
ncbi:MAG: DNA polymerase III subunit delta' C-terminal domain-containing protein, partial [Anaerolineae bacterium]